MAGWMNGSYHFLSTHNVAWATDLWTKDKFDIIIPIVQKRKSRLRSDLTEMIDTGFKCKT